MAGTWGDQLTPQSSYDEVADMYRNLLGREGSPDEINSWVNSGASTGDIYNGIYSSQEAQTYRAGGGGTGNVAYPDYSRGGGTGGGGGGGGGTPPPDGTTTVADPAPPTAGPTGGPGSPAPP